MSFQIQRGAGQDGDRVAQHAHPIIEHDVLGLDSPFEPRLTARSIKLAHELTGTAVEHTSQVLDEDSSVFEDPFALGVLHVQTRLRRLVDQRQASASDANDQGGGIAMGIGMAGALLLGPDQLRDLERAVGAAEYSQSHPVGVHRLGPEIAAEQIEKADVKLEVLGLEPGIAAISG